MTKSTIFVKKKIALLTGGYGAERSVSLKSADHIEGELSTERYDIFVIYLDSDKWYHRDTETEIDRNDFSLHLDNVKIEFDFAFIMIHGDPAENGLLQGYFQSLHIPISTCDTFVSALTFNKYICNVVLAKYGILSARSVLLRTGEDWKKKRINSLGYPMFVKPNNNGSSYGISKVKKEGELEEAIKNGFLFDDELIIEEFMEGREFTCGALKVKDDIITFPVTEIKSYNEYFDFGAKYENESDEITPADLSLELTASCQAVTKRIYSELNCRGMVRADYILKDGVFYLIEVNTIPGMTRQSLVPQQVRAHGWTIEYLLDTIIESCS